MRKCHNDVKGLSCIVTTCRCKRVRPFVPTIIALPLHRKGAVTASFPRRILSRLAPVQVPIAVQSVATETVCKGSYTSPLTQSRCNNTRESILKS